MRNYRVWYCVWAILAGFAVPRVPTLAAEGPFLPLSLEQARARAEKEHKVVFIDFFTTWRVPCKTLDETTWKDKKVVAWLSEKTVPLKIEAEKEEQVANKYNVDGYPTLVFLKPDGTEIDRLVGMQSADEFLEAGNAALSGKGPIARARERLEAAGKDHPIARMDYARALQRKGRNDEALKEYLWCFDEGLKHRPSFYGARLSFLLGDIADLGKKYPPALVALRERRDTARREVLSGKTSPVNVAEFTSLNKYLRTPQENLALYDQLRKEQPKSEAVVQFREDLMGELLKQRRYAEIAEGEGLKAKIDQQFRRYQPGGVDNTMPQEQRRQIEEVFGGLLVEHVCQYYQVLIGLKRLDEAEALAQRLLKVNGSAKAYNALAWNGYLTGAPVDANVFQARKAYELTQGKDTAIVDTLARVLNARGQRQEAVTLVRQAVKSTTSWSERITLARCLADLGENKAAP